MLAPWVAYGYGYLWHLCPDKKTEHRIRQRKFFGFDRRSEKVVTNSSRSGCPLQYLSVSSVPY